ncbi:MAG TPA: phosphohistidine phosphatase SixA [Chthoniobacteraceae bacterium]|jgi:phosphohistidine phosphatase|nr:phosphohistidine phosphatase SixA [Chthoniobacteraceae bacterium]
MLLYILRHADADTEAARDDDRRLSEKGREQAKQVAHFCKKHGLQPSLILSSPLPRAHETAEPVAAALRVEVVIAPWLTSGMTPTTGVEELKAHRAHPCVMIVGHEPDLSALIAHFTGLPSPALVHIRKASLTALHLDVVRAGAGRLEFSLPCKLMS